MYSKQWVCQICISYAIFFAEIGKTKIQFLKGEKLEQHTPTSFRELFPTGEHHLADVTHFPIQSSGDPLLQKLTYSKYKQTNTVTLLFVTAPDSTPEYIAPKLLPGMSFVLCSDMMYCDGCRIF
jgi:hypothetical protein